MFRIQWKYWTINGKYPSYHLFAVITKDGFPISSSFKSDHLQYVVSYEWTETWNQNQDSTDKSVCAIYNWLFLIMVQYQLSLSHPQNLKHYYIDIAQNNIQNPDPSDIQTYLIVQMIMLEVEIYNSWYLFF